MKNIWFFYSEDIVTGPFSTEFVHSEINNNNISPEQLIWGIGLNDWIKVKQWQNEIKKLDENQTKEEPKSWIIRIKNKISAPLTLNELLNALKFVKDLSSVEIKNVHMEDFVSIYCNSKIIERLGVTRRKHPRLNISGQVKLEKNNVIYSGDAITISEGGMGISNLSGVIIGETYRLILSSPTLNFPVKANAEVMYLSKNNFAGIRFTNIQTESLSAIIQYINEKTEKVAA